jgi:hypothetical protein
MEIVLNVLSIAIGFGSATFFNGCELKCLRIQSVMLTRVLYKVVKPAAGTFGKAEIEAAKTGTDAEKKAAKASEEAYKVAGDNIKDYTNILINFGLTTAKDQNKDLASKTLTDIGDKIQYLFYDIVTEWKATISAMNEVFFRGDEKSIAILNRLMRDGRSLQRKSINAFTVEKYVSKFLFSILIPETWRLQGYYPVLLDTAWPCDTKGIGVGQWTNKKNVGNALICREDEKSNDRSGKEYDGRQYHLLAVKGVDSYQCGAARDALGPHEGRSCAKTLEELPGLAALQNKVKQWGELDIHSLVQKQVKLSSVCKLSVNK